MRRRRASGSRRRRAARSRSTVPIGPQVDAWRSRCSASRARRARPSAARRTAGGCSSPAVGPNRDVAGRRVRAGPRRWRPRPPRTAVAATIVTSDARSRSRRAAAGGAAPSRRSSRRGDAEAAEQARREERDQPRIGGLERRQQRPRPECDELGDDARDRRHEAQQGEDAEPDDHREGEVATGDRRPDHAGEGDGDRGHRGQADDEVERAARADRRAGRARPRSTSTRRARPAMRRSSNRRTRIWTESTERRRTDPGGCPSTTAAAPQAASTLPAGTAGSSLRHAASPTMRPTHHQRSKSAGARESRTYGSWPDSNDRTGHRVTGDHLAETVTASGGEAARTHVRVAARRAKPQPRDAVGTLGRKTTTTLTYRMLEARGRQRMRRCASTALRVRTLRPTSLVFQRLDRLLFLPRLSSAWSVRRRGESDECPGTLEYRLATTGAVLHPSVMAVYEAAPHILLGAASASCSGGTVFVAKRVPWERARQVLGTRVSSAAVGRPVGGVDEDMEQPLERAAGVESVRSGWTWTPMMKRPSAARAPDQFAGRPRASVRDETRCEAAGAHALVMERVHRDDPATGRRSGEDPARRVPGAMRRDGSVRAVPHASPACPSTCWRKCAAGERH